MSAGGSSKTSTAELQNAAATLAWALETIGVTKYGFIGGGAVSILSTQYGLVTRQTKNLDLIIQPTSISANTISNSLTTNEDVKGYFVSMRDGYIDKPHVIVPRADSEIYIPVEIFDWHVWPDRQQYYNLDWDANACQLLLVGDRQASLLNTGWLLRQKILAYAQRQNRSGPDMQDITSLGEILALRGETMTITEESEVLALKQVLDSSDAPNLKGWVRCEAVWPTEWTWDARRKDHYRYDESWTKVWGKAFK
ncbi:hypothetical protein DL98DRAFT_517016 [Cadophora sp. DSE1049]|nr:hypothetical protein DL98DRAFT_517016 [Cadophora sp. DSE1049]